MSSRASGHAGPQEPAHEGGCPQGSNDKGSSVEAADPTPRMRFTIAGNHAEWAAAGDPAPAYPRFVHHRTRGVVARLESPAHETAWLDDFCPYHPNDYEIRGHR